jgi:protoporphyrinogen oxidase
VLGGGPAGLGAAWRLAAEGKASVTLFEAAGRVGGNAGSFEWNGVYCDYGSHRLHPAAEPKILADIQSLLGADLLLRPRHGRIRLKESWIHFPLKPIDLAHRLPPAFSFSLVADAAFAKLKAARPAEETFQSVLLRGLGRTMCESFYFPYMKKLWGLEPHQLAPMLAQRRVSGSSLPKLMRKILGALPGLGSPTTGKFYYPRRGYGEICEKIADAARAAGAKLELGARVDGIDIAEGRARAVWVKTGDISERREFDAVWSTLPLTVLAKAAGAAAPIEVGEAARAIRYRSMILIYVALDTDQYTEYDAHYFPELSIPISRLSEPKNYSASTEPKGLTVLCAELPADPAGPYWSMSDEALGAALYQWLAACGLPQAPKIKDAFTRRLAYAYPVYDRGFERQFETLDEWISGVEGLLTFGRQGLFAHDNTHHALAMAYAAVDCLENGSFDRERWRSRREGFLTHVVED